MKNLLIILACVFGMGLLFGGSVQIHGLSLCNFQAFFVIGACIGWWLPSCAAPKDFRPMPLVDFLVGVLSGGICGFYADRVGVGFLGLSAWSYSNR